MVGPTQCLREDERGIEGLPVCPLIAMIVGVASLGVMMSMVSGISGGAVTEVDVQPDPAVVPSGEQSIDVRVIDPDRNGVAEATVIARSGSARLDGIETAKTDEDGLASFEFAPNLGPNRRDGTITFDVQPPVGSEYVDPGENTALLVVEDG